MDEVLALDIGGTKLAAALINPEGEIRDKATVATPTADSDELWTAVLGLCEPLMGPHVEAIGVGCGGPADMVAGTVSPLNIAPWRAFPLGQKLVERFGVAVRVDNDAKAFALGEGWLGAARGVQNYLSMVVSTGVGGGIVLDGRLLDGALGNAGHIGHVIVEPGGHECVCGAKGCLEAEASGTAIAKITGAPSAEADAAMRERCGRLVGRAVGSVCNLLDLQLCTVAGSVALGFGDEFFAAAQQELDRSACLSFSRGARIVPSGCGADGPLIGAAAVGWLAARGKLPRGNIST